MGFLADLLIRIGGDSEDLQKELRTAKRELAGWGRDLESFGSKLTAAVTLPIAGLGAAALKMAGDLEQNSVAFKTMLGSAQAAQTHLNELRDFALKTPFQFNDLVTASKRMQALGFDAKSVIPALRNIGDAAAALGLGAEGVQRIVTALGQMKAKGTIQAEEMKQLAEAGIPAWEMLAKTLNTTVADAMKQVEKRAVDSATFVPAMLAQINQRFGGLMEEQSKTFLGQLSNLKDALMFTLQDLGKTLLPLAKNLMDSALKPMLEGAKDLAAGFAAMSPAMQNVAIGSVALVAAIGPASWAIGGTVSGLSNMISLAMRLPALLNPVSLGIAAIGTAAGLAFYELNRATGKMKSLDEDFSKWISNQIKNTTDFAKTREMLDKALDAGAIGLSDYNQALAILDDREKKATFSGLDFGIKLKETKTIAAETIPVFMKYKDAIPFGSKGMESAIALNEYNLGLARQKQLIEDITKWRNGGAFEAKRESSKIGNAGDIPKTDSRLDTDAADQYIERITAAARKLPPELQQIKDDLAAFGLGGEAVDTLNVRFDRLGGLMESGQIDVETYTRAWIKLIKAMDAAGEPVDPAALKMAINLEKEYGGQIRAAKKEQNEFQKEVSKTFQHMSRGLAQSIVDWKGFKGTILSVGKELASGFLEIMIRDLLKPLEGQMVKLAGSIGKWLGIGSGAASGATGAATSGAGVAGSSASSAGGALSSVGGIAGAVNMASGIVSAISGVFGNFQMYGMNKSLDLVVKHTLQIANDMFNLRRDLWDQHNGMRAITNMIYDRMGDMWATMRDGGGTGGGSRYSLTFNNCPFTGSPDEIANAIFERAALAGA